jgi:hypothetical protein
MRHVFACLLLCLCASVLFAQVETIADSTFENPVDLRIETTYVNIEMNDPPQLKSTFVEEEFEERQTVFFLDFDLRLNLVRNTQTDELLFVRGVLSAGMLRTFGYSTVGYRTGPLSIAAGYGFHLVRVADNPDIGGPAGTGYNYRPLWVCDVDWSSSMFLVESSMQYDIMHMNAFILERDTSGRMSVSVPSSLFLIFALDL